MKPMTLIAAAALTLPLAACETMQYTEGQAVRDLFAAQIADPDAEARNATTLPEGTDSARAVTAVEASRGGVTKAAETWTSTISIGTTSNVSE